MKNLFVIIFLSIVAIMSALLVRSLEEGLDAVDNNTKIREVLIGYDVKARYFDANNQLEYVINSDKVTDLSDKAGTNFEKPYVNYFENMLLQWTMKAEKGHLTADKNELTLTNDVDFLDGPQGENPLSIKGPIMYYFALSHTISGDKQSVINNGIVRQESTRFSLDTITKIIDFNERIKGRYQSAVKPMLKNLEVTP